MNNQKNVLFITLDQMRADCLKGALEGHVDLPNMRALMRDAVAFQNHYTVTAPCGPARTSLLTGQYSMNHRSVRNGTPMRHDTPNIATEMRKAGYLPMLFGYTDTSGDPRIHHPKDPAVQSYEMPMAGFHEMVEMRMEMSHPWRGHLVRKGYQFDGYESIYKPVSEDGGPGRLCDPAFFRAEDSDTAFLTDRFLETMPGYETESWFAHLTYIRPHWPPIAPEPYNRMYDPDTLPLPTRVGSAEEAAALHPFMGPAQKKDLPSKPNLGFPGYEVNHKSTQEARAVYLGLLTEVDHHIGRVIKYLKSSGQYETTLVIVTSDHGEMLGDHFAWGKQSVFDKAYHIPLIVRVPGLEHRAGALVDAPTESIDLVPTVLEWVGQEVPNSVDGSSLSPLLEGETPEIWRKYTFSEYDFYDVETPSPWHNALGFGATESCLSILRDGRYSLVEFGCDLPTILFDHESRGEFENVAEDADYAGEVLRLTRAMLRHRMAHMDQTLAMDQITNKGPIRELRHKPD
ncbi:sulfatase-like hydrolase/transferase [Shimia abyssi]|uniref:Arylsulfatase A-like enzyme n=1 Tax=Shimia abyssi TaxID=1662395 RepID=A0A2P8F6Z4_9RHOB|nr:sulfatase-like hydrolase/transferase [Shimia abyssi]PSL17495.1 arylsulfatase A-like enzyme [Shimia abyssi]